MRCKSGVNMLTIDDLPDDDLLEIFDFYVVRGLDFVEFSGGGTKRKIESWQSLVHVCRRWRRLVFGSPRRLDLQLCCIPDTPDPIPFSWKTLARKTLDVWPALPLLIKGYVYEPSVDDVIAVLKHSDRIRQIDLNCHTNSQFEKLWTAMQVPFPELARLRLSFKFGVFSYGPVRPDSFLGGSAPRPTSSSFGL
jgi:hypothetical protein